MFWASFGFRTQEIAGGGGEGGGVGAADLGCGITALGAYAPKLALSLTLHMPPASGGSIKKSSPFYSCRCPMDEEGPATSTAVQASRVSQIEGSANPEQFSGFTPPPCETPRSVQPCS